MDKIQRCVLPEDIQAAIISKEPLKDYLIRKNYNTLQKEDRVNHPSHYNWLKEKCGIEVIDIARHLDFNIGNAIKYLLRAGYKSEKGYSNNAKTIEDLKKAIWYIQDKIKILEDTSQSAEVLYR